MNFVAYPSFRGGNSSALRQEHIDKPITMMETNNNILEENDLQWIKDMTVKSLIERIQQEVGDKITATANKILQKINLDFKIGENHEKD